jgi:dolichol-phosphate mannosyltransferase
MAMSGPGRAEVTKMDRAIGSTTQDHAPASTAVRPAPELSVVVPTYNERENIPLLVERLKDALQGIDWEAIFVDDNSPDGTAKVARQIGETDSRIRCLRRIGRRGLAGACLEGMLASQARFVAVMDADLQHDETLLAAMVERLRQGDIDLVAASRFADGASATGLSSALRMRISKFGNALAQRVLKAHLSDPMSGFFMLRRTIVETVAPALSNQGFKILFDIVASSQSLRVAELPFVFRKRQHGESKLDTRIAIDFLAVVFTKYVTDKISFRFLMFCAVGLTGVGIHMAALFVTREMTGLSFAPAQGAATVLAIAWNFVLNNALTYRDQRLAGWEFVGGLVRFEIICAVGAISNVGVARWIYNYDPDWWIAGLSGALLSATWNYVVSAAFVWKAR